MYIILNRPILPGELSWRIFHGKSIPQNILDIRTTVKIYEDKVIFISTQDGFQGVVIENRNIAQTMESLFDYIFEGKSPVVEQVPPETKSKNKRKKQ